MKLIDKITFDDDSACLDNVLSERLDIPVVHVKNFHKLNQIVGYAKHINGIDGNIYFRGQAKLYDSCFPSLLRRIEREGVYYQRADKLKKFLNMGCTLVRFT